MMINVFFILRTLPKVHGIGIQADKMEKRHIETQIIDKLRLVERLTAEGKSGAAIAQQLEVSEQTYYRWKKEYAGADKEHMRKL